MSKFLFLLLAIFLPVEGFRPERSRTAGIESRAGGRGGSPGHIVGSGPYMGPYFEFAPPDGGLGTTPCACVNPTGALGQTLTMTRNSAASCLKSNSFTSGILPGDMVWCPTNTVRLAYADTTSHQLGIWTERDKGNNCLRSTELDNAAWTAVAVVTPDTTPGLDGGVNAETLTDSSAVAVEGVTQAFTTAILSVYSWSCFVQGSTATSATISMTGVGDATGDCSATATGIAAGSWTRIGCNSPAAYAGALSAVALSIGVGSTVGVTGDLFVTGCQLERSTNGSPSSYIQTYGAGVTRKGDNLSYALPAPYASPVTDVVAGCTRACVRPGYWPAGTTTSYPGYGLYTGGNGRGVYINSNSTTMKWFDGSSEVNYPTNPTFSSTTSSCFVAGFSDSARTLKVVGGATGTGSFDNTWGIATNFVRIGWGDSGGADLSQYEGVVSQVRFDPQDAGACE